MRPSDLSRIRFSPAFRRRLAVRGELLGRVLEAIVYLGGGLLLVAGALYLLADALPLMWSGGSVPARAQAVLNRVLLVFVLVEVFHTVRLAVTRHVLDPQPFIVVVIIAAVRRVLVLTAGTEPTVSRDSLLELGLLLGLIVAAAASLMMLRRAGSPTIGSGRSSQGGTA